MIANVIVLFALVLAGAYTMLWLRDADLRRRIEEPKRQFQAQVGEYDDRICTNTADEKAGD